MRVFSVPRIFDRMLYGRMLYMGETYKLSLLEDARAFWMKHVVLLMLLPRNERLCQTCNVLDDERHLIYNCYEIDRTGLHLPNTFIDLWKSDEVID